ncbi:MAG: hypothetical protein ACTSPQ_00670 [Candidatus Helarchaeota archaeon]
MENNLELLNKDLISGLSYQLKEREIPIQIPDKIIFELPERIMVLGNNKLLRSTIDYFIDLMIKNEEYKGRIIHVELEDSRTIEDFSKQDYLFTLWSVGLKNNSPEERWDLISSISRVIPLEKWNDIIEYAIKPDLEVIITHFPSSFQLFGIDDSIRNKPPNTYVGVLTSILYERYRRYKSKEHNLSIISLNPLFKGKKTLRDLILEAGKKWYLGEPFLSWIRLKNSFYDSILDKIDIGELDEDEKIGIYKKLNYEDRFITITENYYKWIISKNNTKKQFPLPLKSINHEFTEKIDIFHTLKTWFDALLVAFIPLAYLSGYDKPNDALMDIIINEFFEKFLFNTIRRFIDLSEEKILEWERMTINRLKNPYNKRTLTDMSKNLIQKFRENFLFKMIDLYEKEKKLPDYIFFILATLLKYYNVFEENGKYIGIREAYKEELSLNNMEDLLTKKNEQFDEETHVMDESQIYIIDDRPEVLKEFSSVWKNVKIDDIKSIKIFLGYILTQKNIWGMDLTLWPNLLDRTAYYLEKLLHEDIGKITSELLLGIE